MFDIYFISTNILLVGINTLGGRPIISMESYYLTEATMGFSDNYMLYYNNICC